MNEKVHKKVQQTVNQQGIIIITLHELYMAFHSIHFQRCSKLSSENE